MATKPDGYGQFFKAAREAKNTSPDMGSPKKMLKKKISLENAVPKQRKRKAGPAPLFPIITLGVGLTLAIWASVDRSILENIVSSVEVRVLTLAGAEDKAPATKGKDSSSGDAAKNDPKASTKQEKSASAESPGVKTNSGENKVWTAEQVSLFNKLDERKKSLDQREAELNKLEEELQQQKVMLEKRLKELDELRTRISNRLDEKVKIDQEKVDKLVEVYSNMKAQNAAKIIEDINEDLAIEILSKMKKKSAADILNLLKPEKAQKISEKFAGYKRQE